MKALLLIAHGSRRKESNQEIIELAEKIAGNANEFKTVKGCFLEMATPDITTAIEELVKQKMQHIYVLPYFLAAGSHVTYDVPKFITAARKAHSEIKFELIKYFGSADTILDAIVTHALANSSNIRY